MYFIDMNTKEKISSHIASLFAENITDLLTEDISKNRLEEEIDRNLMVISAYESTFKIGIVCNQEEKNILNNFSFYDGNKYKGFDIMLEE